MVYLEKIQTGYTLKRSEIFFAIEELRTLDFGILIGTFSEYGFSAQYIYWPLAASKTIIATSLRKSEVTAPTPELALQKLALNALNNLEQLQKVAQGYG